MASAQVTSGRWEGATIVVLEIGYTGNHSDRGTTQSVSDALKQYVGSTYTVKYHANGGNGSMDDQKFDMDSTVPLYGNRFTRTGYQFSGWNTKKDGSGTQYSDYNPIYNIANAGEVVDLYAQWTPIPIPCISTLAALAQVEVAVGASPMIRRKICQIQQMWE